MWCMGEVRCSVWVTSLIRRLQSYSHLTLFSNILGFRKDGETICNWKEGTKCLRLLTTNPESWDFWSSGLALHGLLEAIAASTSSPGRSNAYAQMKYGKGYSADAKRIYEEATTFYAGDRLVEAQKTTFADVFRVFYVMTLATFAVYQSSSFAPDTGKAMSSAVLVFAILNRKSEIDPNDESGMAPDTFKGEIDFRHVSFKYPTRPDVEIFRDLWLTI
ncbi:ABC transporter B family member 21-like protein, partial [Tanacetum coccineum]